MFLQQINGQGGLMASAVIAGIGLFGTCAMAAPVIDNPGFETIYATGTTTPVTLAPNGFTEQVGTNVVQQPTSNGGRVDTPGVTDNTTGTYDSGIQNNAGNTNVLVNEPGNFLYGDNPNTVRTLSISGTNTLQPNTTYTLTAQVASRLDKIRQNNLPQNVFIGLDAGGVDLTPVTQSSPDLLGANSGIFQTYTRTYMTGASDPQLGGLLTIRLTSANVAEDNFTLTAVSTPEPAVAGVVMLGGLAAMMKRRRRA